MGSHVSFERARPGICLVADLASIDATVRLTPLAARAARATRATISHHTRRRRGGLQVGLERGGGRGRRVTTPLASSTGSCHRLMVLQHVHSCRRMMMMTNNAAHVIFLVIGEELVRVEFSFSVVGSESVILMMMSVVRQAQMVVVVVICGHAVRCRVRTGQRGEHRGRRCRRMMQVSIAVGVGLGRSRCHRLKWIRRSGGVGCCCCIYSALI